MMLLYTICHIVADSLLTIGNLACCKETKAMNTGLDKCKFDKSVPCFDRLTHVLSVNIEITCEAIPMSSTTYVFLIIEGELLSKTN